MLPTVFATVTARVKASISEGCRFASVMASEIEYARFLANYGRR